MVHPGIGRDINGIERFVFVEHPSEICVDLRAISERVFNSSCHVVCGLFVQVTNCGQPECIKLRCQFNEAACVAESHTPTANHPEF